MKSVVTLLAVLSAPFLLFSQGSWNKYTEYEGQTFSSIKSLELDENENLYFNVINRFIRKDNTNTFEDLSSDEYNDPKYYNLKTIKTVGDSMLWGACELGFLNYNLNTQKLSFIDRKDIMGDWNYGYITGLCIDKSDNIWFTSRTPYISVFDGEKFYDFDVDLSEKILKLPFSNCTLVPDNNSNVWVLGDDGILKISTASLEGNFSYTKFTPEELNFEGKIAQITIDAFGYIWASGKEGELAYYKNDMWNEFTIPAQYIGQIINNENNYIKEFGIDIENNLLLFWKSEKFFLTIDPMMKITKTEFPDEIVDTRASVMSFICSSNGKYWFGTIQNGLISYQLGTSVEEVEITINNLLSDIYIRKLYPNPVIENVSVEMLIYPDNIEKLEAGVYNYMGTKLLDLSDQININYSSGEAEINFSVVNFIQGVYYFHISKGKDSKTMPFVKK